MIKIAVLMSTYNGEKYLKEQIDSILNQKGDFELHLIVRDDGSTDKTTNILDFYQKCGKLIWYTGPNLKTGRSFMDLLHTHPGFDYYAFSDQDDIWDPDKIEIAANELGKYNEPALYYCNSRLVDSGGTPYNCLNYKVISSICVERHNPLNSICCGGITGCSMVMNHKLVDIIRKYGYPEQMIMHDSLIEAVCASINGIIIFDQNPHMNYRQHSNNVIGRKPGIYNAIKYRLGFLSEGSSYSVADQCKSILELYYDVVDKKNLEYLELISRYKDDFIKRIRLAFSSKFQFDSFHNAAFIRLSIILGKR